MSRASRSARLDRRANAEKVLRHGLRLTWAYRCALSTIVMVCGRGCPPARCTTRGAGAQRRWWMQAVARPVIGAAVSKLGVITAAGAAVSVVSGVLVDVRALPPHAPAEFWVLALLAVVADVRPFAVPGVTQRMTTVFLSICFTFSIMLLWGPWPGHRRTDGCRRRCRAAAAPRLYADADHCRKNGVSRSLPPQRCSTSSGLLPSAWATGSAVPTCSRSSRPARHGSWSTICSSVSGSVFCTARPGVTSSHARSPRTSLDRRPPSAGSAAGQCANGLGHRSGPRTRDRG